MTARVIPLEPIVDNEDVGRRTFVKLLGATLLAGSGIGCAAPPGEIVPYVRQPPELVPGVPLHFATAMELDGLGTGLVAESRNGRPVKLEGNPQHPASLGAAGVFHQASVLQLYDPDRGRSITRHGAAAGWSDVAAALSESAVRDRAGARGAGLRLLLEPTASPTRAAAIARLRDRYPEARVYHYAPLSSQTATTAARRLLGRPLSPIFDFTAADVVVSIDADLAGAGPFHLRYARQLADRRRVRHRHDAMNRIYVAEGRYTPTGILADHRLPLRPSEAPALLAELLRAVAAGSGGAPALPPPVGLREPVRHWTAALARDLVAHRGRAVVVVGDRQPVEAHALGIALNDLLGAAGSAVSYVESPLLPSDGDVSELAESIRAGDGSMLLALEGNPAYDMPAGLDFAALLEAVPFSLYAGLYANETARLTDWYLPSTHYLESWGDTRAADGTAAITQPLISPLYGGHGVLELLSLLAGDAASPADLVREYWRASPLLGSATEAWREALRQGVVAGTASPAVQAPVAWDEVVRLDAAPSTSALEVAFVGDASVHDGRFANNAWLQELPDPVCKVTWDNAAFMSAATAAGIGVDASQAVSLDVGGRRLDAPVFVEPGVADGLIVLPFGYGRRGAETVASAVGVNAFALWSGRYVEGNVRASRASALGLPLVHQFAVTSPHWTLEGRDIVRTATLAEFRERPGFTAGQRGPVPRLYDADVLPAAASPQWAMTIDLSVCTGCSGCVVACQAENNVPVVGKPGVQQGREMHWLRIDRYLTGESRLDVQPMLCQHCEAAPCEYVCPVNATVHSPDGLNEMVYNRCVGTRFCSNNCPYKVRRFNFYNYTSEMSETAKMAMNPDVTVRARGVMEKCTFCVQRIRRAQIDSSLAGSEAPLGELQTACQQACPTRAIVFGSMTDPDAAVAESLRADHRYQVLHELGTRPRIWYLARLRNAAPAVPEQPT